MDADIIVIGAGAVGTSAAFHLAKAGKRVIVIEKETGPALHQSGRNSGVIHAGYNVKPGTEKARYCVEGNRRARAYCAERDIPVEVGGILVVARTEAERAVLAELQRRAHANGVASRLVDAAGAREIEPNVEAIEALHAPEAASFDARAYVHALAGDAIRAGASILYDRRVLRIVEDDASVLVRTHKGDVTARVVVNAAGLYADRLARELAPDMRVVPFRGYYAELKPDRRHMVRSHVYAAPDLAFPFLGVHLSRRVDGRVIVGPGAMLAFGREAYRFHQVNVRDLAGTLAWPGFWRMMAKRRFRTLARTEIAKSLQTRAIWREAVQLMPSLQPAELVRSYAGNRAQMVHRDGSLVDDIVVRETPLAVHVLNAVSPGLTCSLPFGEHLASRAIAKL